MSKFPFIFHILVSLIILAKSNFGFAQVDQCNDNLLILKNAIDVSCYSEEVYQVSYFVKSNYPGVELIDQINTYLQNKQFLPLGYDFLNPDSTYSNLWRWYSFPSSQDGNITIHQWLGWWKNNIGDIFWVGLRCYQSGKEKMREINVNMQFTPSKYVKKNN